MTVAGTTGARRTRLEDDRDQLLAAIDGLDRELAAGEIDEVDHRELRDDYTRRAADVLRRLDGSAPGPSQAGSEPQVRRRRSLVLLVSGCTVFAVAAGVLLARASGERQVGGVLTGGVESSSRDRVADCQALGSTGGDLLGSLECFDEVLADDPENPEALAYRGWYLVLAAGSLQDSTTADGADGAAPLAREQAAELTETGLTYLDRAIEADAGYPDPLAFRAVVADRQGRSADACADLDTLRALEPPELFLSMTSGIVERNGC